MALRSLPGSHSADELLFNPYPCTAVCELLCIPSVAECPEATNFKGYTLLLHATILTLVDVLIHDRGAPL